MIKLVIYFPQSVHHRTYLAFLQMTQMDESVNHCYKSDRHRSRLFRAQTIWNLRHELRGSDDTIREAIGHHHKDSVADSKVDNIRTNGLDDPRAFASQIVTINKALCLKDILDKLGYRWEHKVY
jgi:hypothetical protein